VLGGPLVKGVTVGVDYINTHSVVMTSNPRSVRYINSRHLNQ